MPLSGTTVDHEPPVSMRVVRLRAPGGPGQLAVEQAGRPRPCYELAGVIEEVGPGVAAVAPGDEVFALTPFDRRTQRR